MKTTYRMLLSLTLLFTLPSSLPLFAQSVTEEAAPASWIRFAGVEKEYLIFEVDLSPAAGKEGLLRIRDGNRELLFEERLRGGKGTRRYKLRRDGIERLQFELHYNRQLLEERFTVNSYLEEKIEVSKS
jgi:hypothetical protein